MLEDSFCIADFVTNIVGSRLVFPSFDVVNYQPLSNQTAPIPGISALPFQLPYILDMVSANMVYS
jgi:hypothetical protein